MNAFASLRTYATLCPSRSVSTARMAELESMGVRRISTGGSVMCATLGLVRKAVSDLGIGKLDYLDGMIPHAEIKDIFADLASREG